MDKNIKRIILIIITLILSFILYKTKTYYLIKDISYIPLTKVKGKELNIPESNIALKEELKELKSLLNLNTITSTFTYTNATIINRDMMNFYKEVTIDKGKSSGIKKEDVVVSENGLIGRVVDTSNLTSTVRLTTDCDLYNMISVRVENDIYGVLSNYDEATNSYTVDGIESVKEIKEGDTIYTSGLSDIYPNGIKIGTVTRISKDNYDLAYILKVTPSVDYNKLHYVAVINRDN